LNRQQIKKNNARPLPKSKIETIKLAQVALINIKIAARIDRYMEMFNEFPNQEHIKQEIKWAISTLEKQDRITWYLKQYRQSLKTNTPISFKEQLIHFLGMMDIHPKMKSYVFDINKTPDQIFKELKELEKQVQAARVKQDWAGKKISIQEGIEKFIDLGGGWAWWSLNKSYCKVEGSSLAHCGNMEGQSRTTDNILSLRKDVKIDDQIYHQPYLTFIINKGYLGEMKAIANKIPPPSLHPQIIALLKDPRIKGVIGGTYESDFSLVHLTEEQRQEVFKANPQLLPENQNLLDYPTHHRIKVAKNPDTPLEILLQLAKDEDPSIRARVAENPNTPPEILARLAEDEDASIRIAVAKHPNTPPEILAQLAKDLQWENVRRRVAKHPNTPPEVLAQLAKDEDRTVRVHVAENPKTPPKILIQLSKDKWGLVRRRVALNPNTPLETLFQLAKDEDVGVRARVAENPNTPLEILILLSRDRERSKHHSSGQNTKKKTKSSSS
jgi:hypothetical protein